MKRLIIILGMHRSGTSLIAQICRCMGVYLGDDYELFGVSPDNPDGFFENKKIVHINEDILHFYNNEWYSLEELDPNLDFDNCQIIEAAGKINSCIQKLFEKNDKVAIKDPRISVLLPIWKKVLEGIDAEIQYIWVFRNPLEVMESLRKRDGYTNRHSLLLWVHYNLSILKYLKEKKYLLVNYKDVLENSQVMEELSRFLNCKFDDELKQKLSPIIKRGYRHSNYSYQDVCGMQDKLSLDLYRLLLKRKEWKVNIREWETEYEKSTVSVEDRFIDYKVMENIESLKGKDIIIYGAGNRGKKTAKMLQQMGFMEFSFCDKDSRKQGRSLMGAKIYSITEIEKKKNMLIIIAIENKALKKEIEYTLAYLGRENFLLDIRDNL